MVLICICLVGDVEHFSMYLLVICVSSLEKCLLKSFEIFPFLLSCSSLHIVDIKP